MVPDKLFRCTVPADADTATNTGPLDKSSVDSYSLACKQVAHRIDEVASEMELLKLRYERHHYLADQMNSKVLWMSLLESALVFGISFVQLRIVYWMVNKRAERLPF